MKSFKPKGATHKIGNIKNDLFIDIKFLEHYRKAAKSIELWHIQGHEGLISRLGINVFVFDIDLCEFFEEICKNCLSCEEQVGGDGYCYLLRAGVFLDEACPQNSFQKK